MAFRLVHINIHAHNLIIDSAGVKIKAIHSRRAILIMKWNCWSLNALKCCMVVFQTAVFCLTLFVKEILPILDCSAVLVMEELSQLKKEEKQLSSSIFKAENARKRGKKRDSAGNRKWSRLISALLVITFRTQNVQKSDTELVRA